MIFACRSALTFSLTWSGRVAEGVPFLAVSEDPDALKLHLFDEVVEGLEFLFGLTGVADDEAGPHGEPRHLLLEPVQDRADLVRVGAALHALEHVAVDVLDRHVEIGEHFGWSCISSSRGSLMLRSRRT